MAQESLIVVSVAFETLRQVNSRALMVTYDDFGPDELFDSDKKKRNKCRLFKKNTDIKILPKSVEFLRMDYRILDCKINCRQLFSRFWADWRNFITNVISPTPASSEFQTGCWGKSSHPLSY